MSILKKIGLDPFVLGIVIMVVLGYVFPELALIEKPLSLTDVTDVGVGFIFFFYGLKLKPKELKKDLSNWKLHLLIQGVVFLLFPILVLLVYPFFKGGDYFLVWLSFFFLAVLPSTVSSSVVMVSIAGGNIPSAIFNASVSSLLGVFFTPLWMRFFIEDVTGDVDLTGIYTKLFLQVLLPVVIGLGLNKRLGGWAQTKKETLKYFDQAIILLVVYTAFGHSFSEKLFTQFSFTELLMISGGVIVLFFIVLIITRYLARMLNFSKEDQITLVFCSSKKSIIHGTVMAKILFSNPSVVGVLLLPIMIYHAFQLVIISFIAKRIEKQAK